jgi:hypothetical protein
MSRVVDLSVAVDTGTKLLARAKGASACRVFAVLD